MIESEPGLKYRLQELFSNLRQGTLRLGKLFLKSDGLHIGENRLVAKKDADGNQDPYWQRRDGTESNLVVEHETHITLVHSVSGTAF